MRLLSAPLLAVLALGCNPSQGSALRITLDFGSSRAQCARVVVTGRTTVQTNALPRETQPLVVGVAPTYELGSPVTIEALGWATPDCTGGLVAAARPVDVAFPGEGVAEVPMRLEDFGTDGGTGGADGGSDAGTDGGAPDGGAGTDAGTDSGFVDAGRLEFPYLPTNFNRQIDPALTAGEVLLNCGTSSYDSRTNAFVNWCGRPTPTPIVVSRAFTEDVVVLAMRGFTLANNATLKLTGDKGVILAVFGDADVQGFIDADAEQQVAGPGGSKPLYCPFANGGAGGGLFSGAGGGGAGHLNLGSAGGYGFGQVLSFGLGGANAGATFPDPLRGGCSGGAGAVQAVGDTAALGGGGGGALQLSVANQLTVTGRISVAGGGGKGGTANRAGGGGAGSGGGLLLEAQTIQLNGQTMLLANGGGGGGAAEDSDDGDDGENGHNADAMQANGGQEGGSEGGQGGDGETSLGADQQGEEAQANGGGGGGGGASAGRIHLRGVGSCGKGGAVLVSPSFTGACP